MPRLGEPTPTEAPCISRAPLRNNLPETSQGSCPHICRSAGAARAGPLCPELGPRHRAGLWSIPSVFISEPGVQGKRLVAREQTERVSRVPARAQSVNTPGRHVASPELRGGGRGGSSPLVSPATRGRPGVRNPVSYRHFLGLTRAGPPKLVCFTYGFGIPATSPTDRGPRGLSGCVAASSGADLQRGPGCPEVPLRKAGAGGRLLFSFLSHHNSSSRAGPAQPPQAGAGQHPPAPSQGTKRFHGHHPRARFTHGETEAGGHR